MSSAVPWTFNDFHGLNPLGQPGEFEFIVWYELRWSEYNPYPNIELVGASCTRVRYTGANKKRHRPGKVDGDRLAEWFMAYLADNDDEREAIRDQAFELSYVQTSEDDEEPGYD